MNLSELIIEGRKALQTGDRGIRHSVIQALQEQSGVSMRELVEFFRELYTVDTRPENS